MSIDKFIKLGCAVILWFWIALFIIMFAIHLFEMVSHPPLHPPNKVGIGYFLFAF